jgi:hypothetical protein
VLACKQLLLLVLFVAIAPLNLESLFEHAHQQVRLISADRCLDLIHKEREHGETAKMLHF